MVASLALGGCGFIVGVSGDVSLAADAGQADGESDGAGRTDATGYADGTTDTADRADAHDVDAESLEDAEPGRDASRFDAARDARDD